ncbi:MAG: choice-of-anchor L domain-containing protein [Flavobacterium sp.]|uniref:choice-of-anchor L domain-containing protein n=1 Tax=Flavobacterium sp. TaxID=239 RepID=UPI0032631A8B
MKLRLQIIIISVSLFYSSNIFAQNIQVDDTYTAQQLVQQLVNSTCASVTNFSVSGGNFGDGSNSYAAFTNINPSFPFTNGIVLSTGKAASAQGPGGNLSDDGGGVSWGGDSDLNQALNVNNTLNTTLLEFDFIPLTDKISFDYIFASEEYHGNAQCTYSDGFAFLLKKIGDPTYQNLAIVPGTNTPVKVTSVHPDVPGGCSAQNETYFGSYNGSNYPTTFDGQTVVMTAKADVIIGQSYHIKLVIADEANYRYDSAIFLKAGSFQSGTDLGINHLTSTNNPYCAGSSVSFDATQPGINTYKWFKDGVDTGITTPRFNVTDNTNTNVVVYSVEVTLSGGCVSNGEIRIQFDNLPVLSDQTLVQCDDNNDGITIFNLTKLDNLIRNNDPTLGTVSYYQTIGGTQITTPSAYSSSSATIYAEVANSFGCKSTATINLQIANNSVPTQPDITTCDEDGTFDGITKITLPTSLTGVPAGLTTEYYTSVTDAVNQTNAITSPFTNTTPDSQTIYARIINGPDCYGITPINLIVNTFNPPNFGDETLFLCSSNSITLSVDNTFSSYNWVGLNDFDFETDVTLAGTYYVDVTDGNNCPARKTFVVQASAPASNIDAVINDFSENNNTITIIYTDNGGNYIFSVDGINYQESPVFTNLLAGEYTIYVKDKNGCLPTPSKVIYVLDYPKFFTPNSDGINDTWVIKNVKTKPNSIIYIFDRFGKLLKQIDSDSNGWDGTYNGEKLPAADYWFSLTLFNNKTVKSHFTLKR